MGGARRSTAGSKKTTEWEPAPCETGIPEDAGYEWVGAVDDLEEVGFVDDGSGLSFGVTYCYRVVTRYGDGALSLASDEACGRIRKDVPVMTRASVVATGPDGAVLVGMVAALRTGFRWRFRGLTPTPLGPPHGRI